MNSSDIHTISIYQKEYFDILMEFFVGVTGKIPTEFCQMDRFPEAIREMGERYKGNATKFQNSYNYYAKLEEKLKNLYAKESIDCFKSAKKINFCKVNLGGSSRFYETQLNATRKSILFSDIVLIPDPVMPWLESERRHEQFKLVHILQAAYFILHLKDMLSDEFDLPPFLVFPSWEKSLEENDDVTITSTNQLIADTFSYYVDPSIKTIEDVLSFAKLNEKEFLGKIETSNLFISPGGEIGEPLSQAIQNYKHEVEKWRSKEFIDFINSSPDSIVVLNGIMERIQPQFHILENSYEMKSNPLLCVEAQAHYFRLVCNMINQRVSNLDHIDKKTLSILSALMNRRLDFLANINDEQLIFLRKTNENIEFRRKLREFVNSLPETEINDIGYVASEICSQVESLITQHEKEIDSLNKKYGAKHRYTAFIAGGGLAVTMMPALAPFLGAALPLALTAGGKYVANKLEEVQERKTLSGSMMGIFALAKKNRLT
jgi:hypothetical protein